MGKLHKIRKAIEKNPRAWYYLRKRRNAWTGEIITTGPIIYGAEFLRGEWFPSKWNKRPYRSFVKSVLLVLGEISPQ